MQRIREGEEEPLIVIQSWMSLELEGDSGHTIPQDRAVQRSLRLS